MKGKENDSTEKKVYGDIKLIHQILKLSKSPYSFPGQSDISAYIEECNPDGNSQIQTTEDMIAVLKAEIDKLTFNPQAAIQSGTRLYRLFRYNLCIPPEKKDVLIRLLELGYVKIENGVVSECYQCDGDPYTPYDQILCAEYAKGIDPNIPYKDIAELVDEIPSYDLTIYNQLHERYGRCKAFLENAQSYIMHQEEKCKNQKQDEKIEIVNQDKTVELNTEGQEKSRSHGMYNVRAALLAITAVAIAIPIINRGVFSAYMKANDAVRFTMKCFSTASDYVTRNAIDACNTFFRK